MKRYSGSAKQSAHETHTLSDPVGEQTHKG